ncbi:MAG: O-methyltransferase [Bacteriovoracaceae bacterium]|nr:O-methyltransferase [Bacteriovoracaceae bacterium]
MEKTIEQYCLEHSTQPSALTREMAEYTKLHVPGARMLIGELEASLLTFLIHSLGIKSVLELGTFTGYSSLCMAEQLPEDGRITTVDVNKWTTGIAQGFWDKSPHGKKITAILSKGREYLESLNEKFDLIFIDADKNSYPYYVEWAKDHLTEKGIIIVDNTLWSQKVLEISPDEQTQSIMKATQLASSWEGFVTTLLPIRDGMLLIKRKTN